ncbi:MAG TPA: hypothetical protein VF708_18305 [Pyrinomonadaceae bacterium]|jgi:hypothetical protein
MNDTSPEIEEMVREMMMKRSGEERFVMGALMFDAARELIIASLPQNLSPQEFKQRLFERIYGFPLETARNNSHDP